MPTTTRADREERRAEVAMLTRLGLTTPDIAARLAVTERTILRDREKLKLTQPITWRPITDSQHRRALAMIADGASLLEVARTLGFTGNQLRRKYRGMGWTPSQIGAYSAMRRYEQKVLP